MELIAVEDAGGDPSDILEKEAALDFIKKEFAKSTINSQSKNLIISQTEKARQTITKAIDRSYKNMRNSPNEMISLVSYLTNSIKRGKYFIYQDNEIIKWEL